MLENDSTRIVKFMKEFRFLSNMYPVEIEYQGVKYGSTEAAYQAAKCVNPGDKLRISHMSGPESKKAGRAIQMREDWDDVKYDIMKELCTIKFTQNEEMKQKLLATEGYELIEGNWWHDYYWGKDLETEVGENKLGEILMNIRDNIFVDKK